MSGRARKPATMPEDERRKLAALEATLNGERARIVGIRNAFATVANVRTGEAYEWAWPTVALVVARGGRFES